MAHRNRNIFALLDSDDEDSAPKVTKKETPAPGAPVALNKPAAGNKRNTKKPAAEAEKTERKPREGGERAPRSDRAPRGRGGRGGARGGRREYERRSGTGRGRETSKQGGGSHNWGNDKDQTELTAEAAVQDGEKVVPSDEEAAAQAAQEAEEEEQEAQMTLDEYMAKKNAERTGELFADIETREIEVDFSGAVQLTKDGKTPDFFEPQYEKVFSKKTSGRKKQLVTDVGFQHAAPERRFREDREGGRGRGEGRGRGRGRGEGRGRGGRGSAIPNVADMNAFPSLH